RLQELRGTAAEMGTEGICRRGGQRSWDGARGAVDRAAILRFATLRRSVAGSTLLRSVAKRGDHFNLTPTRTTSLFPTQTIEPFLALQPVPQKCSLCSKSLSHV